MYLDHKFETFYQLIRKFYFKMCLFYKIYKKRAKKSTESFSYRELK